MVAFLNYTVSESPSLLYTVSETVYQQSALSKHVKKCLFFLCQARVTEGRANERPTSILPLDILLLSQPLRTKNHNLFLYAGI